MILERIAGERFSRVLPLWTDFPVVVLGGGPSLTPEQFALVRAAHEADAVRVIAVNDSYLAAPWADVCYAADAKWFVWHSTGIDKPKLGLPAAQVRERWNAFAGQKCSIEVEPPYFPEKSHLPDDVHMLRVRTPNLVAGGTHLSDDPGALATGRHDGYNGHSGFQALNLATLAGAKTIALLGFDGGPSDGRTHFHGSHPVPTPADVWDHVRRSFTCVENELKAAGIRVINCSPNSAIGSFEKMNLAEALASCDVLA